MANLKEIRNEEGKLISYFVRVYRGRDASGKQLKPFSTTFNVEPSWTEKGAKRRAEAFAATFEKQCHEGLIGDSRKKFEEYCEYCIHLKERMGVKHTTIMRYHELTSRIYPFIGHLQLKEIRPDILNDLYLSLGKKGVAKNGGVLSNKTILEHHRLIHTVLEQACREGMITYNPADRVERPKVEDKDAHFFRVEEIRAIKKALKEEEAPIRWRALVLLMMDTGCRRGEILGLKWDAVDFDKNRIHICRNIQYTPDKGIYLDSPKTSKSDRYIIVPSESMRLLKELRRWQAEDILAKGEYYKNQGFLFTQDDGMPMHPDSVNKWLRKFSVRHPELPKINPHAFRHTMATTLLAEGMDIIGVSRRLGHAKPSTTVNIYAHLVDESDKSNSDVLERVYSDER